MPYYSGSTSSSMLHRLKVLIVASLFWFLDFRGSAPNILFLYLSSFLTHHCSNGLVQNAEKYEAVSNVKYFYLKILNRIGLLIFLVFSQLQSTVVFFVCLFVYICQFIIGYAKEYRYIGKISGRVSSAEFWFP